VREARQLEVEQSEAGGSGAQSGMFSYVAAEFPSENIVWINVEGDGNGEDCWQEAETKAKPCDMAAAVTKEGANGG